MIYIFIFLVYLIFCVVLFLLVKKLIKNRSKKLKNKKDYNTKKNPGLSKIKSGFFDRIARITGSFFEKFLCDSFRNKYSFITSSLSLNENAIDFSTILGYKIISAVTTGLVISILLKKIYFIIPGFLCFCVIGFFIPDFFLRRAFIKKMEEFEFELPYTIDLLYIATLSGQNIFNSLKILTEKYKSKVSIELSRFLREIKFGVGRTTAYRNALARNKTGSFKNLLFLLVQAEKFGSKISEVLKQKSKFMRFELIKKCEIRSRRVSILLLFPLVFLILPAFVLLVGGPLVYSIAGSFIIS